MKLKLIAALGTIAVVTLVGCGAPQAASQAVEVLVPDSDTENANRALTFASQGCVQFLGVTSSQSFQDEKVLRSITGPWVEATLLDEKWGVLVDAAAYLPVLGMNASEGSPHIGTLESFTAFEKLTAYCDVLAAKGDTGSD